MKNTIKRQQTDSNFIAAYSKPVKIETIKTKREFIRRKADSKTTFITGGYCRFNKAYEITDWNNINKTMYLKKGTIVYIDFEF